MYILKNALLNIRRNKSRNILIGIIIIVIASACTITLAICESAEKIIKSYEEQNQIEATISLNRDNMMQEFRDGNKSQEEMIESFNNIESITEEEIITYGSSKYLNSYYYTFDISVNAQDIKEATDSLIKETTTTETETTTRTEQFESNNKPGMEKGNSGSTTTTDRRTTTTKTERIFNEKAASGAFSLVGYNSYEDMTDFVNGNYTIINGEVSSDFESNTCVISEELATLNNLEVGSIITIVDPKDSTKAYEIEVTGIYKENTDSSSDMKNMFTTSANKIITNVSFIKNMLSENSELKATITPTFIVKDSESLEKFTEELETLGLSSYYQVTSNIDEIENATESIKNVRIFAITFLVITLVIGGVVLIVINMINIRERKYEIGVLRTIGMSKTKVSLQFMLELLIVCLVSLLLGAGVGSFTSVPVANKLLANEIENASSKYENISNNFGKSEITMNDSQSNKKPSFGIAKVEEVESINAVVNMKVLLELLGIGVLLTLMGSLASMVAISRFSPLKILKERS